MKREAMATKRSINFSDTSMFSEEQTSRRSVGDKKKIVLTNRVKDKLSPRQENKQNLPNNISIQLNLNKKQKPVNKQIEEKTKSRHFESESHFYMESSCDCPQDKVEQQFVTKRVSLKDLAHQHILRINRINEGVKVLGKLKTKPCFKKMLQFSVSVQKQQQPLNNLDFNGLQKFVVLIERWVSRMFLGNLRKYIVLTAQKQIQLAVEIIKNRDNQLYELSQRLSFRMLSFVFSKYNDRLLKQSFRTLKMKDKEPVLQHQKIYSFSNSIN